MTINIKLLPFWTKIVGLVLLIISFLAAYLYFLGGKPEIFNFKVFAFISVYLKKQTFAVIQTNILDELAAILFIVGIVLITFSKEKVEKLNYPILRGKAIKHALIITLIIWLLSFLLVYGMVIFIVSASILFLFFIIYNILFYTYLVKENIAENRSIKTISKI